MRCTLVNNVITTIQFNTIYDTDKLSLNLLLSKVTPLPRGHLSRAPHVTSSILSRDSSNTLAGSLHETKPARCCKEEIPITHVKADALFNKVHNNKVVVSEILVDRAMQPSYFYDHNYY